MRRVRQGGRLTTFQVGLIGLVLVVVLAYLAFSKDIPFTRPFEISAVFENSPPVRQGTAVRVAGVDVGKVSAVEPIGGDSPGVKVTMKLEDEALPIHENAEIKARERIFLEGNLFMEVRPGTPDAGEIEDGATIPASQTSAAVEIDQVLGTLTTGTREDLQRLLEGYGEALNGKPGPGEDADQDPDVQGETGGQALNDSLDYSADALRGTAVVNNALLGSELQDLSKLVAGQQKLSQALASREGQLKELIGVRQTPATIAAGFPWLRQARALVSPAGLKGLVDDLQPAVDDFAQFVDGQVDLLPVFDDFNRCQYRVVLASGETVIEDGALSTGLQNYQEFFQALQGFVGAGQNFTGNGVYTRFQPGGGAYPVQTGSVGAVGPRFGNATAPPLGTRPARGPKPPYRRQAKCRLQPVPDLNTARIGPGP